jgi:hypothetical protein
MPRRKEPSAQEAAGSLRAGRALTGTPTTICPEVEAAALASDPAWGRVRADTWTTLAGEGLRIKPWAKTPRDAPAWAYGNWDRVLDGHRVAGCSDRVIRKLLEERVSDLTALAEDLRREPPPPDRRQELENAWKAFHPTWAADCAAQVVEGARKRSRRDPYSLKSIRSALTKAQQRTWEAFRKLVTRGSRGTGQRKRAPSREATALAKWSTRRKRDARLLLLLIHDREPILHVAKTLGFPLNDLLRMIPKTLAGLQKAIDESKKDAGGRSRSAMLNGPRKVPRRTIGTRRLNRGPGHEPSFTEATHE